MTKKIIKLDKAIETFINIVSFIKDNGIIYNYDGTFKNYCKDVDVDNNICGLIVNKDYDNITVTLYTLQGNFKMYIDIYNYIDSTLKTLYIYLRKNSVLDVDTNTQFIFNVDNNNYSIDYKQTINKLQIYLD